MLNQDKVYVDEIFISSVTFYFYLHSDNCVLLNTPFEIESKIILKQEKKWKFIHLNIAPVLSSSCFLNNNLNYFNKYGD